MLGASSPNLGDRAQGGTALRGLGAARGAEVCVESLGGRYRFTGGRSVQTPS